MPPVSDVKQDLTNRLSSSDAKEHFYKKAPKGAVKYECLTCGCSIASSGNAINLKKHSVARHTELVKLFLAQKEQRQSQETGTTEEASNVNKRKSCNDDASPSVLAESESSSNSEPSTSKKTRNTVDKYFNSINNVDDQSDQTANTSVKQKQLKIGESFNAAKGSASEVYSHQRSTRIGLLKLLIRNGVILTTITDYQLKPFKEILPHCNIPSGPMIIKLLREKAKILRPPVIGLIIQQGHWTIDLQVASVTQNLIVAGVFAHFNDLKVSFASPCIALFQFSEMPTAAVMAEKVKSKIAELGLNTVRITAGIACTEIERNVLKLVCSASSPTIECFLIKLEQLFDIIWTNPFVMNLLESVKNLQQSIITNENWKAFFIKECEKSDNMLDPALYFKDEADKGQQLYTFQKFQSAINASLGNPEFSHLSYICAQDFAACKELLKIYTIIATSEQKLLADNEFCTAQVCPFINMLRLLLESKKDQDSPPKKMKTTLGQDLQKRLLDRLSKWFTDRMEIRQFGAFQLLDPRIKDTLFSCGMEFAGQNGNHQNTIKRLLKNKMPIEEPLPASISDDSDDDISFSYSDFTNKKTAGNRSTSRYEIELRHFYTYIVDPDLIQFDDCGNAKNFWVGRVPTEPYLAALAIETLSIPGKRTFSLYKAIHSRNLEKDKNILEDYFFLASLPDPLWF